MSIIQAYKCDHDGKLFEDKAKYQKHLRHLAGVRRHKRVLAKQEQEREQFLDTMGRVGSIEELELFIKDNWRWFWANGAKRESWHLGKTKPDFHEYVEVSFSNVRWSEMASNSHSCPRGGVQNFSWRDDHNLGKPRGYPGWIGNIAIKVRPPMRKYKGKEYMGDGWGSSYFENTPINTGSGGGGGGKDCKTYGYDVKLFAADFPVMHEKLRREQWIENENLKRQKVWKTLGGSGSITQVSEVPGDWVCPDPMIGI